MAEIKRLDPYQPDNMMRYHIALSLVDSMEKQGCISRKDKAKLYTIVADKYRLNPCSIFAA